MATTTSEIPDATATTASEDTAVRMLRDLGAVLARAGGFTTRLLTEPGHVPALIVVNAAASQLSERICASRAGGTWRYWWPWAEPISASADEAAARIAHVLRTR